MRRSTLRRCSSRPTAVSVTLRTRGASPRIGTNLFGVYGRPAGKASGFRYSSLFAKGGWKWDQAALDALITNAQVARPGTTMNYRQPDPKKRALIIQYLKKMR